MFPNRLYRVALAALAALVLLPQATRAVADDATLTIGTIPIDPTAEVYYAQEMGFFKKAGLDVTITPFTSGGAIAAAVVGGAVDIGLADSVSMTSAHARGLPLTYLAPAGIYKKGAETYVIAVPDASPIRTAKDFTGKTIAVNGLKNINEIPTDAWIDNNGGDSKTVKFVEMPVQEMADAMTQNRIDAAVVQEPFIAAAKKNARIYADVFGAIGPSFLVSGYFGTSDFAKANPDLVKSFQRVMRETAIWANKNHAKTADILVSTLHVDAAVVPTMTRAIFAETLLPGQIQPVIDVAVKYGGISNFPASELIYKA